MAVNERHLDDGCDTCTARFQANAERIVANRRRLDDVEQNDQEMARRIEELEAEIQRLTTFVDLMHGNAYSGGHRFKRPVFRVIRGDQEHPTVIAFRPRGTQ